MSQRQMQLWFCVQGFQYLMKYQLVDDTAEELAKFLHSNRQLDPQKKREFLATRSADFLLFRLLFFNNNWYSFLQVYFLQRTLHIILCSELVAANVCCFRSCVAPLGDTLEINDTYSK